MTLGKLCRATTPRLTDSSFIVCLHSVHDKLRTADLYSTSGEKKEIIFTITEKFLPPLTPDLLASGNYL